MKSIAKLYDVETTHHLFTIAISPRAGGQGFSARYWTAHTRRINQEHIDGTVTAAGIEEALNAALARIQLCDDEVLRVYETQGSVKKIILSADDPERPIPKVQE